MCSSDISPLSFSDVQLHIAGGPPRKNGGAILRGKAQESMAPQLAGPIVNLHNGLAFHLCVNPH
jgi:hypothetical protein